MFGDVGDVVVLEHHHTSSLSSFSTYAVVVMSVMSPIIFEVV
jgi:hypothetical protein